MKINSREFERSIRKKIKKLDDRRSYFAQALAITDKMIQDNFAKEGALFEPAGWKPLSPRTVLARERGWGEYVKSSNFRILQNKGKLKSQWKHMSTARFAKLQSGVIYGATHHYGDKSRNIPKRQILPDEKYLMPKLMKLLSLWVRKIIK